MSRLSVFHPSGALGLGANPFGKDVANLQLIRALAQSGGFEQLDILSARPPSEADLAAGLIQDSGSQTRLASGWLLNTGLPAASGALLRGQPYLSELAWLRRRACGDRGYSLLGLAHTLAPPAVRELIAASLSAPVHPWDAVICTSPSVQDGLARMFAELGEHLAERTGGKPPAPPALPIVPLGVEAEAFRRTADRPDARGRVRAELGLTGDDVLVLWVGRLSFFEKAFPQPMFRAVQQAAAMTGAKVAFAMAGWFPREADRAHYAQAAAAYAPDVDVRFEDGNDRARLGDLWAAADVFLSLVDNIQETFGITPLEAMAAGLPVVASDWDGYRFTVRHGEEGFLIPTLGGPESGGLGGTIAARHVFGLDSYQTYVGALAQHTAVHIGRCAEALAALIRSPDLRRRMGEAGRARVRTAFDWPVVAGQYRELVDELSAIRAAAADPPAGRQSDPVRGDPFRDFAHFATDTLTLDTRLAAGLGVTAQDVLGTEAVALDGAYGALRAPVQACAQVLDLLAGGRAMTVREILLAFPADERRRTELALGWMAKHGFVDWLT
ncbi:glycosyltransferase family 4 protein [Phenylobacterium zucineum]|uniref:glycosyltransferase family 4 protein n=1 Tax=Phenylobacterium zucineum TaxID=284016 RepID=UPI0002E51293|nr:glycosyltransferase family 4 protein [Phenylobacterium zucineum]